MTTTKVSTDYGELSIVDRHGYFYAVRTINQKKRQIYLGKSIPDIHTLNEVARDIFSSDREWYKNHPPKYEKLRAKSQDTNISLSLKEDLIRIREIARVLGEDRIAKELSKVINFHF